MGRVKNLNRSNLHLVAAKNFVRVFVLQIVQECFEFARGFGRVENILHGNAVTSVAGGAEPDLQNGFAEFLQMRLANLCVDFEDELGRFSAFVRPFQGKDSIGFGQILGTDAPVAGFGFGRHAVPTLDFSRNTVVECPLLEISFFAFEVSRDRTECLFDGFFFFCLFRFAAPSAAVFQFFSLHKEWGLDDKTRIAPAAIS